MKEVRMQRKRKKGRKKEESKKENLIADKYKEGLSRRKSRSPSSYKSHSDNI